MLKESQLIAIKQLQKECEKADGIQLKLNWEMLREREGRQMDFFHRREWGTYRLFSFIWFWIYR